MNAFEKAENPKLKALLRYLSGGTVTDETRGLAEKAVSFKRQFPDGRSRMKYELDLYDKWCEGKEEGLKEGLSEGIQKGRKEGRDEGILQTAAACRGARPEENKKNRRKSGGRQQQKNIAVTVLLQ